MGAQIRSELLKLRSTWTAPGLFAGMLVLVLFVMLVHGFALTATHMEEDTDQLTMLFGWGEVFGALFAALLGVTSLNGEMRHGTIRPTLLVTPQRRRVVTAKVCAAALVGAGFGFFAAIVATGAGTGALLARGIDIRIGVDGYALLLAGSAAAAALWAVIGVGLGGMVRHQVPALVGPCVWLLFVENVLVGEIAGLTRAGRFLPGAAGRAISGQAPDMLLAPGIALVVLLCYAIAVAAAGGIVTSRRDF